MARAALKALRPAEEPTVVCPKDSTVQLAAACVFMSQPGSRYQDCIGCEVGPQHIEGSALQHCPKCGVWTVGQTIGCQIKCMYCKTVLDELSSRPPTADHYKRSIGRDLFRSINKTETKSGASGRTRPAAQGPSSSNQGPPQGGIRSCRTAGRRKEATGPHKRGQQPSHRTR